MSRSISLELRAQVAQRAVFRCEYCRLSEDCAVYPFQVDHIIAVRHGGQTILENLAYACARCNRNKGTDLTTVITAQNLVVRLFNPRKDLWHDHFEVEAGVIFPKSEVGEATIKLLDFNTPERIIGRQLLAEAGVYP